MGFRRRAGHLLTGRRSTGAKFGWAALAGSLVVGAVGISVVTPAAQAGPGDGVLTLITSMDVNGNGVFDSGTDTPQAGITVTVTDPAGVSHSGTTDAAGTFVMDASSPLTGGRYRVEAEVPAALAPLQPALATPAATANAYRSFVNFVDVSAAANVTLRLGVWDPSTYTGPMKFAIPIQSSTGPGPLDGSYNNALAVYDWTDRGTTAPDSYPLTQDTVGTTYGTAWQPRGQRLFVSAFAKRHAKYGINGGGAIYVVNPYSGDAYQHFVDVPNVGTTAHDLGTSTGLARDNAFFDAPGKESLGSLEISADGTRLYVTNLFTRELVTIDATGSTGTILSSVAIPDPGCAAAGDWRPFAVTEHENSLYIGGVCSAESTGARSDLSAHVYSYAAGTFTEIFSKDLDFRRGKASLWGAGTTYDSWWNAWTPTYSAAQTDIGLQVVRPTPMLTAIDFETDGSLILGFRDRFADQLGYNAYEPTSNLLRVAASGGDINKACFNGTGYDWEGTNGCPNNVTGINEGSQATEVVEFFPGDYAGAGHAEIAQGSLIVPPNSDRIMSTALDPLVAYTGGMVWFDRTNGSGLNGSQTGNALQVITSTAGMGKANGLGEIALLLAEAPIQIGNRVWFDADRDGIQGPAEYPIPGVIVTLSDASGTVATATTDANGEYYFGGIAQSLTPGGEYTLTFDASGAVTAGLPGTPAAVNLRFSQAGAGSDTALDSDPSPTAGNPLVASVEITAPSEPGTVDHTFDAGLHLPVPCSIGDRVWLDSNRNGLQDTGEVGVGGVTVTLLDAAGVPVPGVTPKVTAADGSYLFTGISCGTYRLAFTNLPPGTAFTTPDAGADDIDSDVIVGNSGAMTAPFEVVSDPAAEVDDPTRDAGLVEVCAIGDLVWLDLDRDGVQDAGETGVSGITVTLLDAAGVPVPGVAPVTTGADGRYSFTGLACGPYRVQFSDVPADLGFTTPNIGADDTIDSDAVPTAADSAIGITAVTVLGADPLEPADNEDLTVDAGLVEYCAIGDLVWLDLDEDGVQDAGELGVPGVTVTLLDATGVPVPGVPAVTTDSAGNYAFERIACGSYIVRFSDLDPGERFTTPNVGADDTVDSDATPTPDNPAIADSPVITVGAGQPRVNNTVDAGLLAPSCAVGDFVWLDLDRDGVQDAGEPGLAGIVVTLLDRDGNPAPGVTPVVTGTDGRYVFDDLPCGFYYVEFSDLPDGGRFTDGPGATDAALDSDANSTTGRSGLFQLLVGDPNLRETVPADGVEADLINPTIDAGVIVTCSIGGRVWVDANRNGIQDVGETGIAGIEVRLLDSAGDVVPDADLTTGADGTYLFTDLDCGQYQVQVPSLPAHHTPSAADQGSDDTVDSDFGSGAPGPGIVSGPVVVNLVDGVADLTIDAGLYAQTCAIGDVVWLDLDRDGVQDAGEPGLAGVTVTLLDADGVPVAGAAPVVTAADGSYVFDGLACGSYRVEFSDLPAGGRFTEVNAGDPAADSDADPVTGVSEVFIVSPTDPSSRPVADTDGLTADFVNPTIDAGVIVECSVGDRVWLDLNENGIQDAGEPGFAGVTVTLLNADGTPVSGVTSQITDADGAYLFEDVNCGSYRVQFAGLPAGYVFSPSDQDADEAVDSDVTPDVDDPSVGTTDVVVVGGTEEIENLGVDAGVVAPTCAIGDVVWLDLDRDGVQDAGEPGLAGVTVTLLDADGVPVAGAAPVVTAADGSYVFDGLACGSYRVEFSDLPTGGRFTEVNAGDPAADSDADPVTGVSEVFIVSPTDPSSRPVADTDGLTADFVNPTIDAGVIVECSIGDRVWLDLNENGIQDADEPGFAGITVTLLDADGNPVAGVDPQVTDGDGRYLFTDLYCGSYRVQFSGLPAGYDFTPADQGDDDAVDSDAVPTAADPSIGISDPLTVDLEVGVDGVTVDAGLIGPTCAIGDLVFFDANGNGIQDAGESGISGVIVTLLGADGEPIAGIDPVATDADGRYLFDELPCGSYRVAFSGLPAGAGFSPQYTDDDPAVDSDVDPATGVSGPVTIGDGETTTRESTEDDGTASFFIDDTVDAGVTITCVIGDLVWFDQNADGVQDAGEPGAEGVTVQLLDATGTVVATAVTDADGRYLFDGMGCGTYRVLFTALPGYEFTSAGQGDPATDSDADAAGASGEVVVDLYSPADLTVDAGLVRPESLPIAQPLPATGVGSWTTTALWTGALLLLLGAGLVGLGRYRRTQRS